MSKNKVIGVSLVVAGVAMGVTAICMVVANRFINRAERRVDGILIDVKNIVDGESELSEHLKKNMGIVVVGIKIALLREEIGDLTNIKDSKLKCRFQTVLIKLDVAEQIIAKL